MQAVGITNTVAQLISKYLFSSLPQAGMASYPQRRCVFLLGCDSAAASVSAIAFFDFKIKLTEKRGGLCGYWCRSVCTKLSFTPIAET